MAGEFFINTKNGGPSTPFMHYHDSYDIYCMESGSREYFVEDTFFTASAGDFILIKPGSFHRIGQGQVLRTLVSFTAAFLEQTFSVAAVRKMTACFHRPLICPDDSIRSRLQQLLEELRSSSDDTEKAVCLARLLLTLERCERATGYDPQLSGILKYINRNFSKPCTLDQIADYAGLSKQHLCRRFKCAMGMTLVQYLNQIRVKNACTLLARTDKEISDICGLCGFSSSAYFSTVFKTITGISPRKYRRSRGMI